MKTQLLEKLNSEIEVKSVFTNTQLASGHKAITDKNSGEVLGIVGKNYSPITNEDFTHLAHEIQKTESFELKGFDELNKGKIVLGFLEYKGENQFLNGCGFSDYLVLGNSHDGTRPFFAGATNNLARCQNQFYSSIKLVNKKHTSHFSVNQHLVDTIIASYKAGRKTVLKKLENLDKVKVDEKVVEELITDLYKRIYWDSSMPKPGEKINVPSMNTLRDCIYKEMGDIGLNAFGLFNGVTWYTTHAMRGSHKHFGNTEGTARLLNQRAFQFVSNLKNKTIKP